MILGIGVILGLGLGLGTFENDGVLDLSSVHAYMLAVWKCSLK